MTHRNSSALDDGKQQATYRNLANLLAFFVFFSLLSIRDSPRVLGSAVDPPWQSAQEATQQPDSASDEKDVRPLEQGHPIKRDLAGGQRHAYRIRLNAGQVLKVVVEQQGIDVVAQASGPNDKRIVEVDSESRPLGREEVRLLAEAAGDYRLIVRPKQNETAAGSYEIRIEELRTVTEDDRSMLDVGKLYQEFLKLQGAGKYDEAALPIERALSILERILGPDHRDVATALNGLAVVYMNKGEYAKAEPLFERALTIWERTLGPKHPNLALTLNNLAYLYGERGEPVRAEPLAQRALEICERALGREHPNVAMALNTLAILYSRRGDYAKAEPLLERALAIWERTLGREHPNVTLPLGNLAAIYFDKGEYAKGEPLLQRALAIQEKTLGPEHPDVARTLSNLATVHLNQGEYAKAEPLFKRALAIREKTLGSEHPNVGLLLSNLANLYRNKGEYAKAEPLYQRARAIFERTLGPRHPNLANTLNDLAVLYTAKGDIAQAMEMQSRANDIAEYNLALNLATGSERQKLAYLAFSTKQTDFTFFLHTQIAPDDLQTLTLAFTTLLRQKGRGLDAMAGAIAALRRHTITQDQKLFSRLTEARSELAALILKESDAANPDTYRTRLRPLEEKIENLEAELSARSAVYRAQAQPVTLSAVQSALPAGSALVEFVFYTPQEPQTGKRRPPRYLAYLLAAHGEPKYVDLGEAAPIERAVDAWRQSLRENSPDVNQLGRAADELVMRPVRSWLRSLLGKMPGETPRLLIAPDGSLNLIPFAALVDEENRYLIERYTISYLTSGRDLLRMQTTQPSKSAPLVVANPLFGRAVNIAMRGDQYSGNSPSGNKPSGQGERQSDPPRIFFRPLPGTKDEALAIKAVLPEAALLLQQQATEAALKRARAPRILHIATHGFFLGDQEDSGAEMRLGDDPLRISDLRLSKWAAHIENPLLRSGLALAGANRGKNGDDDGVLTALEVAGLDLWGTKLVVLSACDTGLGEVRNGEGVQGLRRALVLAGSESQVMSLWAVPDEWAKDVMIPYYRALRRGEGRSEGLRQVQLRMLRSKNRHHPFHWAAFIQSGVWANLNSRR